MATTNLTDISKTTQESHIAKSQFINHKLNEKSLHKVDMANPSAQHPTTSDVKYPVPKHLLIEIARALTNIRGWGSVEIFIQNHRVTQITERNINKTDAQLRVDEEVF